MNLVSTYRIAFWEPLDIGPLPVDPRSDSLSLLSHIGIRINVDAHTSSVLHRHENGHLSTRPSRLE